MLRPFLALVLSIALHAFASAQPADAVVWSGAVELPGGAQLEFSVALEKDSGTITIPLQHVKDLPLSDVSVTEKELKFSIKAAGAVWELKVADDGQTASGVLKQGGEHKTTLKRLAPGETAVKELRRPQEPKPPFPYTAVEVAFANEHAKATFAGTLTVPSGTGPFPCVVLVTGSGPQDRDETLLGHRPFLVIADHLTRHGIAVLRYDDRGVAKSTGSRESATSDDYAEDALAAVAFLKSRKEVDAKKIGVVGHSEGGLIAPMCAARSKDVAFLVLLAGTGMRGAELLALQGKLISAAEGMPTAEAERQATESAELYAMVVAGKSDAEVKEAMRTIVIRQLRVAPETKASSGDELQKQADEIVDAQSKELLSPWFKRFMALDPRENLAQVTCPVLAVNGSKDLQVPPKENLSLIEKALKDAGNKDVTIVEFPGLNHLFQTCTTGSPSEYATIEETFSPTALAAISDWILARTRSK
ncbi:MAG: alpha/beta fold hydrolase [Planctomycetes bacterium]|nr:alpha/beta fold hydrolase [Planctomycetota bacterium]